MKRILIAALAFAAALAASGSSQPGSVWNAEAASRRILYYRNAMGLPDTSPVPKKDSMGMDYIPVYADEVTKVPGAIRLTTEKIQRAGVATTLVARMPLVKSVRATGTVAADENRQAVLSARFTGFVEKLYVSQTGDVVRAGQPLMRAWVESPEVLIKEADFIGSLASNAPAHAASAANLLRQYGIPQSELNAMARTGIPTRSITITAPASGTVMEKPVVLGMHFATGDTLFKTTDVTQLWVLAEVSERDLGAVRKGQKAAITFRDDPSASFDGKVLFVYPQLDPATRTVKVRIAVSNRENRLRIGQYADVRIDAPGLSATALGVPASAVVDDGTRQVAFVAQPGGLFEPRTLKLGARSRDMVEVLTGLKEGERVVTSGNFLIDAESNLQTALQTFGKTK
jgi:Cu(I)/Ag(I) efflux system membrane fusion protein